MYGSESNEFVRCFSHNVLNITRVCVNSNLIEINSLSAKHGKSPKPFIEKAL